MINQPKVRNPDKMTGNPTTTNGSYSSKALTVLFNSNAIVDDYQARDRLDKPETLSLLA